MSLWAKLKNATLTFSRPTAMVIDPNTGNEIPSDYETLVVDAYFKKAKINDRDGIGVPIGAYQVEGYVDGILPAWCNLPSSPKVECSIDWLGSGYFVHQGKIAVVRDRVESISGGTPIQGYFVIQGSGDG